MNTVLDNEILLKEIQKNVLEGKEIIKVKDNRTFHIVFNLQDEKAILWFMSQISERKMEDIQKIIQIENAELKPLNLYDKGKTVDFIVSVGDDVIVVEMNNNNTGRDYTRNLFYTFHALLNKVEIGGKYKRRHGILVNLNWFTDNKDYSKNISGVTEVKYPYPVLGQETNDNIITVKNVNLSFYDNVVYNGVNMKDFVWKLFTIDKLEDIRDVKEHIEELSHYCNELERLSMDKEYCMTVWNERLEENLQGITFYEDGKKDGEANAKKEIIIKMYNKNIDISSIADFVDLSPDEIQKIIDSEKE